MDLSLRFIIASFGPTHARILLVCCKDMRTRKIVGHEIPVSSNFALGFDLLYKRCQREPLSFWYALFTVWDAYEQRLQINYGTAECIDNVLRTFIHRG